MGLIHFHCLPVPADFVMGPNPQGGLVGILSHHDVHSEDIQQFAYHCVSPFDGGAARSFF